MDDITYTKEECAARYNEGFSCAIDNLYHRLDKLQCALEDLVLADNIKSIVSLVLFMVNDELQKLYKDHENDQQIDNIYDLKAKLRALEEPKYV